MKRRNIHLLVLLTMLCFSGNVISQTLIHYWNFNNSATTTDLLTVSTSIVSGASITHEAGGTSAIQATSNTTGQGFEITNPNARNSDAAGSHLRFNNPIGGGLTFALPTTGYKDVIVKLATRRSAQGAGSQLIAYSTGGAYIPFDTLYPIDGNPIAETIDFSSISAADNNADFKIQITFIQGGGGTGGNNRIDNVTLEGASISGGDNLAPTLVFAPVNNTEFVPVSVLPTLTFNEDIRLVNNTALDNNNVDTLIEVHKDDSAGTLVAFDASVSGRVITITPNAALLNSQKYYILLKANHIEDLSNNAITAKNAASFTTISLQTVFSAGDIVPVAYRMNATSTEDEIALLTFKDILPGTRINLTDSKYTDNVQPQCPGSLIWTAPQSGVAAGTVISIQTSAVISSIGTIAGGSFGLSSGGDQVIIYTGTADAPNYITAFSSNLWVNSNTICSGSESKIPAALTDGTNAINFSTSPGNVTGNTANGYYSGTMSGTISQLRASILNPANWNGAASGTAPQTWPTWAFPGPPSVVSAKTLSSTSIQLAFSRDLDNATAADVNNFTGIANISSVSRTQNGSLADTLIITYSVPFSGNTAYTLNVSGVKDSENRTMVGTYTFNFTYSTSIAFEKKFITVSEGTATLALNITLTNPSACSVSLAVKAAPFSTALAATDFTLSTQTLNFTGASATTQTINIPILNDKLEEQDEYFVLSLESPSGATITGSPYTTIFIKDNDRKAKTPSKEIELSYIGSFNPSPSNGSTTEIVVHDPVSQRLFMTSAIQDRLDIADFSNPANITLIKSIDMSAYGGITSVAVKNGVVAVASPNVNEQLNGSVVFFNTNGDFQKQVTVGALPDMITFTPNGNKILTANEGQPNDAYTVDPEGSVSVIDISGGLASLSQSNVTTISFSNFNSQEAALIAAGVRKLKTSSTLSQDFEPEYIAVSADSKKAWVTLQENNAVAELNLDNNTTNSIWALGTKDCNALGNGIDASDNNSTILMANWPVRSFHMPDGVATYQANGFNYIVTANEGDEKEYSGLNERVAVNSNAVVLDPKTFPNAAVLKEDHNLGRLRVTNLNGDTDKDGDYDVLYSNGSRSFSIFNADLKTKIFDSGDDFEMFTATEPSISPLFNADNESNGLKTRSRAKGPEPEGVAIAKVGSKTYAFISLERVGGVMVYNITDPSNVTFVDYKNSRSLASYTGDHGPEGIIYIAPGSSPDGKAYVAVANEISGTVSVFRLENVLVSVDKTTWKDPNNFVIYPNPNNGGTLNFNMPASIEVSDVTGSMVYKAENVQSINVSGFTKGMYFVKTSEGIVRQLIVQ